MAEKSKRLAGENSPRDGVITRFEVKQQDERDDDMIIEMEDETIDTDNASHEELVEALIKLKKACDQNDKHWNKRTAAMKAAGLTFADIGGPVASLDIYDREKASKWFAEALAEVEAG